MSYPAVRGGSPSPAGGSNDAGPTAMRRMIGFKSAGQSDAGFLRRRATSGLDSLVCASASHCMHGAFESEPLHCIRALPQKSTGNLDVARDLHKEDGARRAARTNVSRETFEEGEPVAPAFHPAFHPARCPPRSLHHAQDRIIPVIDCHRVIEYLDSRH